MDEITFAYCNYHTNSNIETGYNCVGKRRPAMLLVHKASQSSRRRQRLLGGEEKKTF